MTNDFVRGGVSGVGFINIASGIAELTAIFAMRPLPTAEAPRDPAGIEP